VFSCLEVFSSTQHARFSALYEEFAPIIYARCESMLRDAAAAADATQETFIRLYGKLEHLDDKRDALALIYRVATNHCLNLVRDTRRREELLGTFLPKLDLDGENAWLEADLARRLVSGVPIEVAAIAWLHHVDGLSQAEVSEVIGVSRRTVVNRLAEFKRSCALLVGENVP
jgi:RNA polymerase sigma-70 factor (ECF subfamily)